jgi:hypothetical protein
MSDESEVQQHIQIHGPFEQTMLLRNNSGALKDVTGRSVRYGLGNISKKQNEKFKSSDLIGIRTVTITESMVGKTVGIFVAIEVKKSEWVRSPTDKREIAQENFINWVKARGGIAGFCKSVSDFKELIYNYGKYLLK